MKEIPQMPKPERPENKPDFLLRMAEYDRAEKLFRYGWLERDHPSQKYIDQLVSQIKQIPGFPLKVYLCPDWREINACAYPDGSVLLASRAVEFAETEEAVQGIIGHEYTHVHQEHSRKVRAKDKRSTFSFSTMAERISMKRIAEYQADLQGALIDLDKAGINPLGYKIFLEKLGERERGQGKSVTHGSTVDRALNAASAIHMLDFRNIAQDLHEIDPRFFEALKQPEKRHSHIKILFNPHEAPAKQDVKAGLRERQSQIESLSLEDLPRAIRAMDEQMKYKKKKPEYGEYDQRVVQELRKRFYRACLPEDLSEHPRAQKILSRLFEMEKDSQWLGANPEEMEAARGFLERELPRTRVGLIPVPARELSSEAAKKALELKMLHAESGDLDIQAVRKFIQAWGSTLDEVASRHGIYETQPVDEGMLRRIWKDADQKGKTQIEKEYPEMDFKLNQAAILKPQEELSEIEKKGTELMGLYTPNELDEFISSLGIPFATMDLKSLGRVLKELDMGAHTTAQYQHSLGEVGRLTELEVLPLKLYYLFEKCVKLLPEYKGRTAWQNQVISHVVRDYLGIDQSLKFFHDADEARSSYLDGVEKWGGVRPDPEEFQSYETAKNLKPLALNKVFARKEGVIIKPGLALEDLAFLYHWVDKEYYEQNVGITSRLMPVEGELLRSQVAHSFVLFVKDKTWEETIDAFDKLEAAGVPIYKFLGEQSEAAGPIVSKLAQALKSGELENIDLRKLLTISNWIRNPFMRRAFQGYSRKVHWDAMSFDDRLSLVFPRAGEVGVAEVNTQQDFTEHDIYSRDRFAAVKNRLKSSVHELVSEGSAMAGVGALMSNLGTRSLDINHLMRGLMLSQRDEGVLKTFLYETLGANLRFWEDDLEGNESYDDDTTDMDDGKSGPSEREKEAREAMMKSVSKCERVLKSFYTLDPVGRAMLLRNLLTGDQGLLIDASRRPEFFRFLLKDWVEQDAAHPELHRLFDDVRESLAYMKDWQLLYFIMHGLLTERIAVPPSKKQEVAWTEVYDIQTDLQSLYGEHIDDRQMKKLLQGATQTTVSKGMAKSPHRYSDAWIRQSEAALQSVLQEAGALGAATVEQMKPLSFIKEAASKMGAPGVRFLQVLPQFVNLSPQYEQAFLDVYDGVKGQSKLAALALLEREWPQVWDELPTIGDRVGGGSIVSVYQSVNKEGEKEVLKVRNPNILYHTNEIFRFAKLVLNDMAKRRGGAYNAASAALDDIKAWIEGDISFENFLRQDAEFREKHSGFKPEGFSYEMYVPVSKGPENPYFAREEYIDGMNLTQWDGLKQSGHDMKQIMSLILKSYINQLIEGQMHSDVHIGNYRVTPERRVAMLDRNFFIELSESERMAVLAQFSPSASTANRIDAFQELLGREATSVPQVRALVERIVGHLEGQRWGDVSRAIVAIKQAGVKVPLKITLLLKNFSSIQTMARKAGFANLMEAYLHQPE